MKLLLLSALCLVAQANWKDNNLFKSSLVMQHQEYDAETEAGFATEKGVNDAVINGRTSAETAAFKQIFDLMNALRDNIGTERTTAKGEATKDRATNTNDNAVEVGDANTEHTTRIGVLTSATATAQQEAATALSNKESAHNRLTAATTEQNHAIAQDAAATSTAVEMAASMAQQCAGVKELAVASEARLARAAAAQLEQDKAYLSEARDIVAQVQGLVTEHQGLEGAGAGSRFPGQGSLLGHGAYSMLSMDQRMAINQLAIKYIDENRGVEQHGNVLEVLQEILTQIGKEEALVQAAYEADLAAYAAATAAAVKTCADATAAMEIHTDELVSAATTRLGLANTEFGAATNHYNAMDSIWETKDAARVAAEAYEAEQTPIANKRLADRLAAEQARFDARTDAIDALEKSANDYLDGELTTLSSIEQILVGLNGVTNGGNLLIEQSNKMIRHFLGKYIDNLGAHSATKDQMMEILATMKTTAASGKTSEEQRIAGLKGDNDDLRNKLIEESEARKNAVILKNQQAVSNARAALGVAQGEEAVASSQEQHARGVMDAQAIKLSATKDARTAAIAQAQIAKDNAEAAADATFTSDTTLATSKKDQSLKYLGEESDVIGQIRTLLEGINMEATVDSVLESSTTSESQKGALIQLLTLAGKYDNTANAGYTGMTGNQKERISTLLGEIDEKIAQEITNVGVTFDADTAVILQDKTDAYATALGLYNGVVNQHNGHVLREEQQLATDTGIHAGTAQVLETKTAARIGAEKDLASALETQTLEVNAATEADVADQATANRFHDERNTALNLELSTELTRLDNTVTAAESIEALIGKMNFASSLLQKYDDTLTTYRGNHTSGPMKERVLALLDSMISHVGLQSARCASEFASDNINNGAERTAVDNAATALHKEQIDHLDNAVTAAQTAKEGSDAALALATAVHLAASNAHNANMDTRATAKKIQETNTPVFQADYDATAAIAQDVQDEEMEIINSKFQLASFYLDTESAHLSAIENMLSSLDILTTTNTHDIGADTYGTRPTLDFDNIVSGFDARHEEETARERLVGQDTDDISVDVDDHTLTADRGLSTTYDERGEEISLLQTRMGKSSSRAKVTPTTVGLAIDEIMAWVSGEKGKIQASLQSETAAATERLNVLLKHASDFQSNVLKTDADRLAEAIAAEGLSFTALEAATNNKIDAQATATANAATLADALATQAKYTPLVNAQLQASLAANHKAFSDSAASIAAKKNDCDGYLSEEKTLLESVVSEINAGLAKASLVEMATSTAARALQRMAKYDFTVQTARSFDDQQAGDYMTQGVADSYKVDTSSLGSMIASIKAKNEEVLAKVGATYTQEHTDYTTEKDTEIARSQKVLADTQAMLQGVVNDATAARDLAEGNRAAQQIVKETANADYVAKSNDLVSALQTQETEVDIALGIFATENGTAHATFDRETAAYDTLKGQVVVMLNKELSLIEQIRGALNGDGFMASATPVHRAVETCEELKTDAAGKAATCTAAVQACNSERIAAIGAGTFSAPGAECTKSDADCAAAEAAKVAYTACVSKPALLMTKVQAKSHLEALGKKYISEGYSYEEQKAEIVQALAAIEAKIQAEETAAKQQYDADYASTTTKKNNHVADATLARDTVINTQAGLVNVAEKAKAAALTVLETETGKYNDLVDVLTAKAGELVAALNRQKNEGEAAVEKSGAEILAANTYFQEGTARILEMKLADEAYINGELNVVTVVEAILANLGIL